MFICVYPFQIFVSEVLPWIVPVFTWDPPPPAIDDSPPRRPSLDRRCVEWVPTISVIFLAISGTPVPTGAGPSDISVPGHHLDPRLRNGKRPNPKATNLAMPKFNLKIKGVDSRDKEVTDLKIKSKIKSPAAHSSRTDATSNSKSKSKDISVQFDEAVKANRGGSRSGSETDSKAVASLKMKRRAGSSGEEGASGSGVEGARQALKRSGDGKSASQAQIRSGDGKGPAPGPKQKANASEGRKTGGTRAWAFPLKTEGLKEPFFLECVLVRGNQRHHLRQCHYVDLYTEIPPLLPNRLSHTSRKIKQMQFAIPTPRLLQFTIWMHIDVQVWVFCDPTNSN